MTMADGRNSTRGGVFFDLDGTLVDTAPDMVAVLVAMQESKGSIPVPYELARASVSHGALGLINLAFPSVGEVIRSELHQEFLDRYEQAVCIASALFPGMDDLLHLLEGRGRPWGVVTNKPERMTDPLLEKLELSHRMSCAVSGDTLPQRKPHPAPLLLACELAGVAPEQSIFVGDDARDIVAGRAAGMATIAAAYGYITAEDDPVLWEADQIAGDTMELTRMICDAMKLYS
jgi:N-acetyl-D-muramate 6-phosphate phosphatase